MLFKRKNSDVFKFKTKLNKIQMKYFATAALILGANAVRSQVKAGKDLQEDCNGVCAEGYFYTSTYYDCENKTDPSDYYWPEPQCHRLCTDKGYGCPEEQKDPVNSPEH